MKGKSKKGNFSSYQPQYASSASVTTPKGKASDVNTGYMPVTRGPGMGGHNSAAGTRPTRPKQGNRRGGEIGGM